MLGKLPEYSTHSQDTGGTREKMANVLLGNIEHIISAEIGNVTFPLYYAQCMTLLKHCLACNLITATYLF